jgi:hypothetical protein
VLSQKNILYWAKPLIFVLACCPLLLAEDLNNQSINSGGGWASNYENSSFTIMGETFQSAQVDLLQTSLFYEFDGQFSADLLDYQSFHQIPHIGWRWILNVKIDFVEA